jgi:hypothetical protein
MFSQDRVQLRTFYRSSFEALKNGLPLEPLQALVAQVVVEHPEYQLALENADSAHKDFQVATGESNPFLHMGMHVALREQMMADRPAGISVLYRTLCLKAGDPHAAEHMMMECLGEAMWRAQSNNTAPDEEAFLACVRRLLA